MIDVNRKEETIKVVYNDSKDSICEAGQERVCCFEEVRLGIPRKVKQREPKVTG
jgi:hypothetical protein